MKTLMTGSAFVGAMAGSMLLQLAWPTSHEEVVRANRFEVISGGRTIGTWSANGLSMRREQMNGGLSVSFQEDGSCTLTLERSNVPTKELAGRDGKLVEHFNVNQPTLILQVDKDGRASIETRDAAGKPTWKSP